MSTNAFRKLYISIPHPSYSLLLILAVPFISNRLDLAQVGMRPEGVWKWLEAVDQEHLDPLDHWRVPTLQIPTQQTALKSNNVFRSHDARLILHTDALSPLNAPPPSKLLLRTGTVRMIGTNPSSDEGKNQHPKPLVPNNSLATVTLDLKRKPCSQPVVAPSTVTSPKATAQPAHPSPTRPLQPSNQETKHIAIRRKRLPTYLERAHTEETLKSIPVIQVEGTDPVAGEGLGERVVGGDRSGKGGNSRRHTTAAGEGALRRSNALKRSFNRRPVAGFGRID